MQNGTISLEKHQDDVNYYEMLAIAVEASAGPQIRKTFWRHRATQKRMEHHPDHWFIDPGSGQQTEPGRLRRRALQACWADCPMKARLLCLDRGMQEGPTLQYGIYGGYTEKQRQKVVEDRKKKEEERAESSTESAD